MWSALLPFLLQFSLQSCVLGDGTYECGDHGRFEYCIDEIPGCVIGCHCHPGYYFDTDTKICEPNSKLIEHHRRNNVVNPAPVQTIDVTPSVIYDPEPASSTNTIETQVDDIAKDANDLGDWLYNQFFKTIENQVINNTNDKNIINRRSGSQQLKNKPKRSKKWRKGGKSKQRGKKKQLRRKLLRITENDSLFDISSESSSESSDSSSSGDLTSMEYKVDENTQHKHDDDEHGHKKIVMINKKPKQPLPSFIFLPNLDTPFYPPIGLPPPPIVPMYPMVPVPPVPLCPITGCIESTDNNVATNSSASTTNTVAAATTSVITSVPAVTSVPSTASETSADATEVDQTTDEPTTTADPKTDAKALRLKKKKKKKAAKLSNSDIADTEQRINSLNYIDRQRFLERLKEKMDNPFAKLSMPSWKKNKKIYTNKFVNQNTELESPFFNNGIVDGEFSNNERNAKPMREDGSFPDNVDFKYITELIHRVDPNNKSHDLPPIEYNPLDNKYQSPKIHKNQFFDYNVPLDIPDGRRINRPMHQKSDESYYTNLGRQIATMIREIGTKENIELQETQSNIKNDPYFKNNSPTSFWERSVRSPLAYLKTKNNKFEHLKKSNELLFDIENKVEIIASTVPSLTLQEIENIVKVMEATKREIQSKNKPNMKNPESAYKNLNVDLWPQKSHDSMHSFKNSILPYSNKIGPEITGNSYKSNNNNIVHPNDLTGVRRKGSQKFVAWNGKNVNNNIKSMNQTRNIPTTAKPAFLNNYIRISPTNYNSEKRDQIHKIPQITNPLSQNTIYSSFLNQPKSPYFLHQRKYFQDNNNNYYVSQNVELAQVPQVVKITPVVQPSYFSEINQFDYMDK